MRLRAHSLWMNLGFVLSLFIIFSLFSSAQPLDVSKFAGMKARTIGPAGMSGRVTAIAVVHDNPNFMYIGAASGGVWKSTDGGVAWTPIFDDQPVAGIGALAVNQQNPDILWVGTGEGNPRNSENGGNGVYKSMDGGRTWIHLGLENTRNIHRIILDPTNPDIAYIGAKGPTWGETESRGVFKTTDGGKSWLRILFTDVRSGVGEMVMDPQNPKKMIVGMWEHRRWPWFFKSGGPGSGLFLTTDGGNTWKRLGKEDGLPEGDIGRTGIAIAPSRPNIVYALVESKKNGLYKSLNGGYTWSFVTDKNIGSRPFYFWEIYADPSNENRIYNLHVVVDQSEDGGKTFQNLIPYNDIHPDYHAMWIHPKNPDHIMVGNDGGVAISQDRGKTWRFVENLPLAQFYHINVDNAKPYNVYGGLQDNGSWRGPAYVWRAGGIRNSMWEEVCFGDGFDVVLDPSNDRFVYAMSQQGGLVRTDLVNGEQKLIKPKHPEDKPLRFNWNAGLATDPFSPETIYYGSQFVHKSTDRGDSWSIISPDLTTNNPEKQKQAESGGLTIDQTGAENHTTITAIAPSNMQQGLIWVGTDDGLVQLTQDGGQNWANVTPNIKGLPANIWVNQIRASTYNPAETFIVLDNHRMNDWNPYVFHTKDFGKTWTRIVQPQQVFGYALTILQDHEQPNLLFLGTETGLYVSIDFGKNWSKWKAGFPTVPTMDLALQTREADLVAGTFGRGVYVLDDIRPLRTLAQNTSTLQNPLTLFPIPEAVLSSWAEASGTRFAGAGIFSGENRPRGAMITYALNIAKAKESAGKDGKLPTNVTIEVFNQSGEKIRTLRRKAEDGVQRFFWGLNKKGVRGPGQPKPTDPEAPEPGGASVLPGTYKVVVVFGSHRSEQQVTVSSDPNETATTEAMGTNALLIERVERATEAATAAADQIREAQRTLRLIEEQVKDRTDDPAKTVKDKGKEAGEALKLLLENMIGKETGQGISRNPNTVSAKLGNARSYLGSSFNAAGLTEQWAVEHAEASVRASITSVNEFFSRTWPTYKEVVKAAQIELFNPIEPIQY